MTVSSGSTHHRSVRRVRSLIAARPFGFLGPDPGDWPVAAAGAVMVSCAPLGIGSQTTCGTQRYQYRPAARRLSAGAADALVVGVAPEIRLVRSVRDELQAGEAVAG